MQTTGTNSRFKIIGFKGKGPETTSNYENETNACLIEQESTGRAIMADHHTANTNRGDMEICIITRITATSPKDRDLILGLVNAGINRLMYTATTPEEHTLSSEGKD